MYVFMMLSWLVSILMVYKMFKALFPNAPFIETLQKDKDLFVLVFMGTVWISFILCILQICLNELFWKFPY